MLYIDSFQLLYSFLPKLLEAIPVDGANKVTSHCQFAVHGVGRANPGGGGVAIYWAPCNSLCYHLGLGIPLLLGLVRV